MNGRPLPILYVHHRPELGGAPQSLLHLIESLDRERFEPHVFCPPGAAADLFHRAGATVHTGAVAGFTHIWASIYRGRRWLLFARELALLPRHVIEFRRVLRRNRFALVHLNDAPPIAAALMAKRAGIPVVWHIRSSLPDGGRDPRSRLVRAAIRRLAAASIAINEDITRTYAVGSDTVPNSVDLDRFRPGDTADAKRQLGLSTEAPVVSYFGFLYPSKGFRQFIEAARLILDWGLDASFLVVGGAVRGEEFFRTLRGRILLRMGLVRNYELEARQLVAELGLEQRLRFVPFTRHTARFYQASDIVVAPSQGPELGRPVIEGAACGVAVVASGSRTGGGIVVPGETGILVEDSVVGSLAAATAALLRDPERRRALGAAAREHAETTFDPATNTRRIERLYLVVSRALERTPILYVHHRPQLGGAPSSLAELIRNLDPRFEPHVLVPDGPAAKLFENAGAVVHRGDVAIFAHAWDNPYRGLRWLVLGREAAALPGHVRQLRKLMRIHGFPIVHLNDSPLLAAAQIAHASGAKVVWHLRSALAGEGQDLRSRAITTLIDRWGDAAIAIDRDVAARFPIKLPLTIIHNSVRPTSLETDPRASKTALGVPEDRIAIGFAGFVRRQKGWPELVEAATMLVERGAPVHFVIMGGGVRSPEYFRTVSGRLLAFLDVVRDEESAIKELVARNGLTGHFSFLPFTADTGEIYDALDIVTFPNQGIGLGRPVLEAAMHGTPVVASGSVDGAGLMVPGGTGLLLDRGTPTELANALWTLVEDPDLRLRLGAAAADHARKRFDPVMNATAVAALYDALLGIRVPAAEAAIEDSVSAAVR